MLKVQIERPIAAPAQRAWAVLRTFGLDYFKGYPHTVTGSGIGAERTFTLPDGEMTERISAFDDAGMHLDYIIVHGPWPVTNYTATIRVSPEGEGCLVTWSAAFSATENNTDVAAELVYNTFKANLRALEKFVSL